MELSIAYVNDVHGYLEPHAELFYREGEEIIEQAGGYAAIATKIKDLKLQNKNMLFFDGGDTFHGTIPVVQSRGEVLIPILNKLGFTAMVAHWDFAYGPQQLKKLASQLNYPILGINIYNEDGSLFLTPYIIKEVEDVKIAVIGICSNIIDKTMPAVFSKGLKITDGAKELPLAIQQVKKEGADIVILLSHNGFPQDVKLLSTIQGVDICLSAHTHNRLYEAAKINNSIIIQCGCHGSFLGHLKLDIQQKKINHCSYELIVINNVIKADSEIEKIVSEIMEPFQHLKKEITGKTPVILHRYNTIASSIDDLLLTSMLSVTNAEIAFSNGWRYGVPIAAGAISRWDLYNIIPMNPVVSTVKLKGNEIKQILEENLERTFSNEPLQQMGGYVKRCLGLYIKMRIENPKGHRIQQIFIGDEPLINEKIYTVAFATEQGVPEKMGTDRQNLSIKTVDAMAEYLKGIKEYHPVSGNSFSLV